MKRIGFWDSVFNDVGAREREALNEAAHALEMQTIESNNHDRRIEKLLALDRAQGEEIAQLRVLVDVLSTMLVDAKVLDSQTMKDRVRDKQRALMEASRPKRGQDTDSSDHPYRGGSPVRAAVPEATVDCKHCAEQVFARNTQITAIGPVCDVCYWALDGQKADFDL